MKKLKDLKNQQGFTIIEVMIVLVIAAVIILIVFLAVPALQRNSRNNQRKTDVSRVASGVTEWTNNNNGVFPVGATQQTQALQNIGNGSYYQAAPDWKTGSQTNDTTPETLVIVTNASCSSGNSVASAGRRFVVLYSVESGSGSTAQCLES